VGQRLGVTDTWVLWGPGGGNFQISILNVLSSSVFPPLSSDRSPLGPENLSPPPWSLGNFEQLVASVTLHDPNIFGPQ
jgi:hypothetical protein